ncbi:MAG: hypothetical protein K2Y39_14600 [Candidatus Obscuribacterales bacterium]|nr:hypothetical protein [Candidatus Obscuribacterales bacterium]
MNTNTNITTTGNGDDLIPGTNWTYAAAASMAKEVTRENRLFGNRSNRRRRAKRNDGVGLMVSAPTRFTAETGWTPEDALEMALEHRREARIFGRDLGAGIGEDEIETLDGNSRGDDFYVIDEHGCIDKRATRERRLFGSRLWN